MAAGGRIKISGTGALRLQLNRRGSSARSYRAAVGFTAEYALFVHEDMEANHPNGGQAKFLEQPARTMQRPMGRIVEKHLKRKDGKLKDGVQESAEFLLAEAKKLVPVDTGNLRDSGYAKVTNYGTDPWEGK